MQALKIDNERERENPLASTKEYRAFSFLFFSFLFFSRISMYKKPSPLSRATKQVRSTLVSTPEERSRQGQGEGEGEGERKDKDNEEIVFRTRGRCVAIAMSWDGFAPAASAILKFPRCGRRRTHTRESRSRVGSRR